MGGATSRTAATPAEGGGAEHIQDFELLKRVGQGAFATVWRARRRSDSLVVAMKIQEKAMLESTRNVDRILNERRILERVAHPFVVSLVAAFQSPEYVYLALSWAAHGDLSHLLPRLGRPLAPAEAAVYGAEVALALAHLHEANIVCVHGILSLSSLTRWDMALRSLGIAI